MTPERMDARLSLSLWVVGSLGVIVTAFAGLGWGARAMGSVASGAVLAAANLYALARILGALLSGPGPSGAARRGGSVAGWALLALVKMSVLFGGIWLLMTRGYVDALPLVVGYGSLPVGIAVAAVMADRLHA